MGNLKETTNMLRVQYREWFPQIIYNHHQTGPAGTIIFAPPFRDPPNHFLDPLIMTSIEQVGTAMHHRFVQEGKGGSTMRSGASYSIWWNGGLRTTPYFHNSVGLLTEIKGGPNPEEIAFVPQRQLATTDLPLPFEPGILRFRTAIEYSQTANWAVMDYASRNKDMVLFNIWRMGQNSIDKGRMDSWTVRPSEIYAAADELGSLGSNGTREDYVRFLEDPAKRDPRGFILASDQSDFPTAVAFANTLVKNGVEVLEATRDFRVQGKDYPAGSLVVKTDQAYRPHILDMFEPQDHPNDFEYPGGPPIPPYDATGWTLAFQMGVEFDRILDGFDGPFQPVNEIMVPPQGSVIPAPGSSVGYLLAHDSNNAFKAVYALLSEGRNVFWLTQPMASGGRTFPKGTYWVPDTGNMTGRLSALARELGVDFHGSSASPSGQAMALRKPRIGLWDQYGGSAPSGWIRFILEEFGYDYSLVFPQELDAGDLASRFDVLIFPDGAIPRAGRSGSGRYGGSGGGAPRTEGIPPQYWDRLGSVSAETTIPHLEAFLQAGGTIVAIEGSTALGYHLGLPIRDFLVDEDGAPLRSEEFFVPGSLLEVEVDLERPVTAGLGETLVVNFARSPVFGLQEPASNVHVLATYADEKPLRSGWAWGQEKLQGGSALLEATVGEGTLFLFGPQVTFRGQTHAAYPLLFNGILLSSADQATLR
jgi:hypothetical protein